MIDMLVIFTPQLAGKARQLGCPKIVLDHMRTSIGDALATGIQAPAGTCKLMNIAIRTNCIKYQMLHVSLI